MRGAIRTGDGSGYGSCHMTFELSAIVLEFPFCMNYKETIPYSDIEKIYQTKHYF